MYHHLPLPIPRDSCPIVAPGRIIVVAKVNHRLHGEHMPLLHYSLGFILMIMWYIRRRME